MIKNFRCKETERVFNRLFARKLPQELQRLMYKKLLMLNRAGSLTDLRVPPSNHLEALRGNRVGQHSIRINDQWRICFIWQGADALNVEIVDYHR